MDPDLDLDLAFRLQLDEAIAASLASTTTPSTSQVPQTLTPDLQTLLADRYRAIAELQLVAADLRRRVLDSRLAASLQSLSSDDDSDDDENNPPIEEAPPFKLYFKGVSIAPDRRRRQRRAAIGVSVCDPDDKEVLRVQKAVEEANAKTVCREVLETEALVEGLHAALALGIRRVDVFCDYRPLYYHVNGIWPAKKNKIAAGINEVLSLQRKFERCEMFLLPRSRSRFVSRLARDVIDSMTNTGSDGSRIVEETCKICLESTDSLQMFTVSTEDTCLHRFCFSCMKQHVEVQLLHGVLPNCPHDGCNVKLNIEGAKEFLPAKLLAIMDERLKEASIPANEKIYCPYPKCSALMSISEAILPQESSSKKFIVDESVLRKCIKCNGSFCIACKVPWHERVPCNVYQRLHKYTNNEERKLRTLATQNLWRQCVKCNHMIELAEGCFHMTCRCGYEFCYTCGAEWKEKKATCSCPLWNEDNIWYNDSDDDSEDFDDDYDYDDEDDDTEDNIVDHRRHNFRLL